MEENSITTWTRWYNQQIQFFFNYVQINNFYQENIRKRRAAALVAVLLNVKKRKYSHKKYWIAPIFQARKEHGFFHAVLPKLVLEDLRFHNYIRISATQLEDLILKKEIKKGIYKIDKHTKYL